MNNNLYSLAGDDCLWGKASPAPSATQGRRKVAKGFN